MNFFDWLWHSLAVVPDFWVYLGSWVFVVGVVVLVWVLIGRHGNVSLGEEEIGPSEAPTALLPITPAEPIAPNYLADFYPLAGYLTRVIDADAEATTELARVIAVTETVEIRAVDPLDATTELEHVDPSVPLFYEIRRPRPYVAESFTEGITRAQIERALNKGRGSR